MLFAPTSAIYLIYKAEVESRMSLATRTHFEVLGFEAQILGLEPYKSFKNDLSSAPGQDCFLIGQKKNNQT